MLSSDFLIRRYSPPTCTLEIWGQNSFFVWQSSRKVINETTFKLHFDDPKLPDTQQITLSGDRIELQYLCDVVTSYIQNLVRVCADNFSDHSNCLTLEQAQEQKAVVSEEEKEPQWPEIELPKLKPVNLYHHKLDFGSLNSDKIQSSINLSICQLFDLANALEEYNNDVESFPGLYAAKTRKKILVWGSVAAVIILGVSTPLVGVKLGLLNPQISFNNRQSPSNQSNLREILPPVPPPPNTEEVPSPELPPTLAEQEPLSPPDNITPAEAPPRNPDVEVVVPPSRVLPPPPNVPPAPEQTTIVVTPHSPENITPPQVSRQPGQNMANPYPVLADQGMLSYTVPTLPDLPPLVASSPANPQPNYNPVPPNQDNSSLSRLPREKTPLAKNSLLDTIPQVAEVREYFQERWQPPEKLQQTLEYRLILAPDGSLARINPLGGAARLYLDRTNMPLIGESFVSAPEVENPQIRLVLGPDGTVKTFLEPNQLTSSRS